MSNRRIGYLICLLITFTVLVIFPNYGSAAFFLYGLGSYSLAGIGLISVGYGLWNIVKGNIEDNGNTPVPDKPFRVYNVNSVYESDENDYPIDVTERVKYEDESYEKTIKLSMKTVIGLVVIGAILLILGIVKVSHFNKDFGNEPRVSTIDHAQVVSRHSASGKAGSSIRYYLEGKDDREAVKLSLKGVNSKWVDSSISNKGTLVVTYYPNTGVIVSIERDLNAEEYGYGEYDPSASSYNQQMIEQMIQRNQEMLDTINEEGVEGYINSVIPTN